MKRSEYKGIMIITSIMMLIPVVMGVICGINFQMKLQPILEQIIRRMAGAVNL